MERWSGRVAIVTGAGAGIGAAVAKKLVKYGLDVVGVDYNSHSKIEEAVDNLRNSPGKLYALKADVSKAEDIQEVFSWVKKNLGRLNILVNCAGVCVAVGLIEFDDSAMHKMYDVNVIGLLSFAREAIKYMKEIGVEDGHIVNIASMAASSCPRHILLIPYASTKHAVKFLSEGLRVELVQQKSKIRVTNVSPGPVDTGMLRDTKIPNYETIQKLQPEDIADGIIYALGAPPHVQVHELSIIPVGLEILNS